MGIIQRQSIKYSIISVIGILIGALSVIYVYPNNRELYGLMLFISDFGTLLVPILALGIPSLAVRYFPIFKDEKKQNQGFFGLLTLLTVVAIAISVALLFFFKEGIVNILVTLQFEAEETARLGQYKVQVLVAATLLAFSMLFTNYISNFGRIAIPNAFNNLFLKLAFPAIVLLSISGWVSIPLAINILLIAYGVITLGLLFYIIHLGAFHIKPKFSFLNRSLLRDMAVFAAFAILSSSGSMLASRIDSIMISSLLDFENNGDYGILRFMANTIQIAYMALIAIAGPIVAQKIKTNNLSDVHTLYQKTSINGLLLGSFIFISVYANLDYLLQLTSSYGTLKPLMDVFLFLGLAKLFDVATSVNHHIITYSKYYRFNLVLVLLLAFFNIAANYFFIKTLHLGEIGAAMATCLSIFLFNASKFIFIWIKYRMQPFTAATLKLLIIASIILAIALFIPIPFSPIIAILIKGITISILYGLSIFYFKISEDANQLIIKYWQLIKSKGLGK